MPPAVTLIVLLLAALFATIALIVHALARMLLHPPRMTDGKALYVMQRMSPADLGLPFERLAFDVRDAASGSSLRIAAWWIVSATTADRTCILIHGYGDAKVGALAWAPMLRALGWNLLLIDLRDHGESGDAACTGGYSERDDLDAVIDHLHVARAAACRHLALFGVSLGGAVALATAARRDDVDAVIADGVFADYAEAARAHGRLIGAPLPGLFPLVARWAGRLAGVRFADVRPLDAIRACKCPVLLIHGDADPFVPDETLSRLHAALRSRASAHDEAVVFEGAGHCVALAVDPGRYASVVAQFLDRVTPATERRRAGTAP